jgi:hypothetical protein
VERSLRLGSARNAAADARCSRRRRSLRGPLARAAGLDLAGYQQKLAQSPSRAWTTFRGIALVLGPCTEPPFPLAATSSEASARALLQAMRLVVTVNALGLPAAKPVPVGVAADCRRACS